MSSDEEQDQLGDIAQFYQNQDTSHIPTNLHLDHHEAPPMDDDCWKSQAVVDRDMLDEVDERVNWINFVDGTFTSVFCSLLSVLVFVFVSC